MRLDDLKRALDVAPVPTVLMDDDGRIVCSNDQFTEMFGYGRQEAVGLPLDRLLPSARRTAHRRLRKRYLLHACPHEVGGGRQLWALRKDGKRLHIQLALARVEIDSGHFIIASFRELSKILQLRSALERTEDLNRAVLASLTDHIAVVDSAGRVVATNPAWARFAERNGDTLLKSLNAGDVLTDVHGRVADMGDASAERVLDAVDSVIRGDHRECSVEHVCSTRDRTYWFSTTVLSIGGNSNRAVICQSDITELRATEARLRETVREMDQLKEHLQAENVYLHEQLDRSRGYDEIIGQSRAVQETMELVERVAGTDANVLLSGETGTGKGLFARAIHQRSRRFQGPLVIVNCAALPSSLIESEMFGHVRGAFTGAVRDRRGRFELADGGTLFLDEVGEIDLELQAKLLRVLENQEFERIGSHATIQTDVRIIAASNRDLERAVREGRFRPDLYFRLAVFPIDIPPLRDRVEDIPLLVWHFVAHKSRMLAKRITTISEQAMRACMLYDWPGNVRELANVVERALILSNGEELALEDSLTLRSSESAEEPSVPIMERVRQTHIMRVLEDCNWVIKGPGNAADQLGMAPSTLRYHIKKLGIAIP